MLNNEILKASKFDVDWDHGMSSKSIVHMLFVLILAGKGTEEVEKLSGKILSSKFNEEQLNGLVIPECTELLILDEKDIQTFLKKGILYDLRQLSV
jgi:hypothetical protein